MNKNIYTNFMEQPIAIEELNSGGLFLVGKTTHYGSIGETLSLSHINNYYQNQEMAHSA
jgi:hypothetical protein